MLSHPSYSYKHSTSVIIYNAQLNCLCQVHKLHAVL